MKKLMLFIVMFVFSIASFAQNKEPEEARPMTDSEIVRKCSLFDIEGELYENVVVTMKSNEPDYVFTDKYKVKITVEDTAGNKVWSKTFKNAFLYVFSSGQIHVGRPKFSKLVIDRTDDKKEWIGVIREKEGVY